MAMNLIQTFKNRAGTCFKTYLSPKQSTRTSPVRTGHHSNRLQKNLDMTPQLPGFPAGSYESYTTSGPAPIMQPPPSRAPSQSSSRNPSCSCSLSNSSSSSSPRSSRSPSSAYSPSSSRSSSRSRSTGRSSRSSATSLPLNSQINWSTSYMNREELTEIFNLLHETLSHVPYAICGLTALIDHGLTRRKANRISILCPQESKNNVKAWAAARGYPTTADSLGLPGRDGSLRRVRIKYIDTGFEHLQRVRSQLSKATVLSPTSQLDHVAAGYLENRRRGDARALETVSKDLFWCLEYMATSQIRLNPRLLPTFLGEEFFVDFIASYPAAEMACFRAGIDVSAVLERHYAAAALREHDEMLRLYGMAGDVLPSCPGQFERMRDLTHSKSVYTLRDAAGIVPAPLCIPSRRGGDLDSDLEPRECWL